MTFDYTPPQHGQDNTFPRFYTRPVQNNVKSEAEGRPIFDDCEYVEIIVAGDSRTTVDRRVKEEDKHRWPGPYAAYKAGREQSMEGTPLEAWPLLTPSLVMEYKALKIFTVEQLANMSDSNLAALGTGGRTIRDRAAAWLAQASGDAPLSKAQSEIEALRSQSEVDKATIAAQNQEIERLKSKIVEQVA